jgi:Mn-containing catalase
MFFRQNRLHFHARPERPDPVYAKQLQEVLGGQWGEISVMMTTCSRVGTAAARPSTAT